MKKRIDELDIVKGIAIIYVFLRHLCELTGVHTYGSAFYSLFDCCTEAFMFLFILLSGYVYKSKGTIRMDLWNKFKQLLIPYLTYCSFFSVTYLIRYVLFSDMTPRMFLRNTISNFLAAPNLDIPALASGSNVMRYAFVPYWYIAEIFMAFILFIAIHKWLENKKTRTKAAAAICLLLITAALMHLNIRSLLTDTFASSASYFTIGINIVGFTALLLIGTLLRQFRIFDIEAHPKCFTTILFAVSLLFTTFQIAIYNNAYALQYGKWGASGIWSVGITTLTGFTLTYSLIYISYYLKRIRPLKTALMFLGSHTLEILLLHFGIAELLCMIFGFWVPIYDISYPAESFAWSHFFLVTVCTAVILLGFLYIKARYKTKNPSDMESPFPKRREIATSRIMNLSPSFTIRHF